ncbi:MAG: MFS transporter [Sphingomonadaceae bacterium]
MAQAASRDPRTIIDDNPMNVRQWIVVILMIALNALDGFDVLSSAFAAPGISQEWGVPRSALGIVLSAELVGMGVGSLLLGGMADRFGRKPTMLACLVVMAIGMYLASAAGDVTPLTVWRFITGIGIGGMLAATNAVVAETTSKKSRSIAMALYVIGYPLGGVIGGFLAQGWLLVDYDWRAVFLFGAIVTAIMVPLVLLLVPETPAYYEARRTSVSLDGINRAMRAFSKPEIAELLPQSPAAASARVSDILTNPKLRPVSLLLALGYMFHTITFYYILKWAVKIVADSGFSQPEAASVLTYANIGGAIGGFLFGFLMKRWSIKGPTVIILLIGAASVSAFGLGQDTLWGWRSAACAAMFFTNAAIVGFYAAFALGFPAYARATGTGFVLSIGRLGAASSPIIAGYLFDALGNDQLFTVSTIMAMGSVAAAIMIMLLPLRDADADLGDLPAGEPID